MVFFNGVTPFDHTPGQAPHAGGFGQQEMHLVGFFLGVGLMERDREHDVGWSGRCRRIWEEPGKG